jgi:hypothetical protein
MQSFCAVVLIWNYFSDVIIVVHMVDPAQIMPLNKKLTRGQTGE